MFPTNPEEEPNLHIHFFFKNSGKLQAFKNEYVVICVSGFSYKLCLKIHYVLTLTGHKGGFNIKALLIITLGSNHFM